MASQVWLSLYVPLAAAATIHVYSCLLHQQAVVVIFLLLLLLLSLSIHLS